MCRMRSPSHLRLLVPENGLSGTSCNDSRLLSSRHSNLHSVWLFEMSTLVAVRTYAGLIFGKRLSIITEFRCVACRAFRFCSTWLK